MLGLKFDKEAFMAHPLLTSLFVIDIALLLFTHLIRFPALVSVVLVCGLVYLSAFFTLKLNSINSVG